MPSNLKAQNLGPKSDLNTKPSDLVSDALSIVAIVRSELIKCCQYKCLKLKQCHSIVKLNSNKSRRKGEKAKSVNPPSKQSFHMQTRAGKL